jgi:hypothetical protein
MLYTLIQEVLGSNLGRDTGYPDNFRGFPHSIQANTRTKLPLGHDLFLPDSSFISHQPLDAIFWELTAFYNTLVLIFLCII